VEADREVEQAMRKSQFSEEQIIGILRLAEAGQRVAEVCRQHGISQGTYYRWKAQDGGLEVSQLRRLRQWEEENRRLKQIGADRTLDKTALKEITRRDQPKKLVTPTARRAAVGHLQQTYALSQRRAWRLVGAHRHTMRYVRPIRSDELAVRERLRTLAAERPRWGYRRLHLLLNRELGSSNHQRVKGRYRLEGLAIRRRKRKRVARTPRGVVAVSWQPGEAWAMDAHAGCVGRRPTLAHPQCPRSRHAGMRSD
jgi:putative transposase